MNQEVERNMKASSVAEANVICQVQNLYGKDILRQV